jgi:hypothetical protein
MTVKNDSIAFVQGPRTRRSLRSGWPARNRRWHSVRTKPRGVYAVSAFLTVNRFCMEICYGHVAP